MQAISSTEAQTAWLAKNDLNMTAESHLDLSSLVPAVVPAAAGRGSFLRLRQRPSAVLLRPPLPLGPPSQYIGSLTGFQRTVHLIRRRKMGDLNVDKWA